MKTIIIILFLSPAAIFGQLTKQDSLCLPFIPLIGSREGKGEGMPGIGSYERSYQFIFNKRFIEVKNKTIYPPGEKNEKGVVHEDIGYT